MSTSKAQLPSSLGEAIDTKQTFDLVGFIINYEEGDLPEDEIVRGFQHLIDTGLCWGLQRHYGRTAARLIRAGLCQPPK